MKLFDQYMAIFGNLSPSSNHLHSLQVENSDTNSRLVVDGDENGEFRPERFNENISLYCALYLYVYMFNSFWKHKLYIKLR